VYFAAIAERRSPQPQIPRNRLRGRPQTLPVDALAIRLFLQLSLCCLRGLPIKHFAFASQPVVLYIYRVAQKSKPQSFVQIFVKY